VSAPDGEEERRAELPQPSLVCESQGYACYYSFAAVGCTIKKGRHDKFSECSRCKRNRCQVACSGIAASPLRVSQPAFAAARHAALNASETHLAAICGTALPSFPGQQPLPCFKGTVASRATRGILGTRGLCCRLSANAFGLHFRRRSSVCCCSAGGIRR